MIDVVIAVLLGAVVTAAAYGIDELDRADRIPAVRNLAALGFLVCAAGGAILITSVANRPAYALIGVAAVAAIWMRTPRRD